MRPQPKNNYFIRTNLHEPGERSFSGLMPFVRLLLPLLICLQVALKLEAQAIPQWWKDTHQYNELLDWADYMTYTTAFFGPNALPVPELSDGIIEPHHQFEFSTSLFWGPGEQTQSLATRLSYVFIPNRLSVSAWGVLAEHYRTSAEIRDQRASLIQEAEELIFIGDFYIATQMRLFAEKKIMPEILAEIVLKTASSTRPLGARYFDTPGYYFDLSFGKNLYSSQTSLLKSIRLVAMGGFLCYQMNNNYQNDAPLYAAKVKLDFGALSWENGFGGYCGWTGNGDCPLVLRSRLDFAPGKHKAFIQYQSGLNDYIAHSIQAGWVFTFGK